MSRRTSLRDKHLRTYLLTRATMMDEWSGDKSSHLVARPARES